MSDGPNHAREFLLPVAEVGTGPLRWAVAASIAVHLAGVVLVTSFPTQDRRVGRADPFSTTRYIELGVREARPASASVEEFTFGSPADGLQDVAPTTSPSARAAPAASEASDLPLPAAPSSELGPRRSAPGLWGLEAVETAPGPPVFQGQFTAEVRALNDSLALAASQPEAGWGVDDGSRGKLGVSSDRLYLGSFSIPLRTDGQLIFSDPRDQQDPQRRIERALDERTRVQDALQDRARRMRARRDSIRSGGGR